MNAPNLVAVAAGRAANTAKTFVLPDKCFEKRAGCAWGRGNKLTIYPRSQTVNATPNDEASTSKDCLVNIRQDILLFTPILRRLVNESNGTYLSLQKAAEAAKTTDNQVEFLKLSRQFRSIIRVCMESLQKAAENEQNAIEKNSILSHITIFYSVECIWHLCEILFIDSIPGDIVLPYLMEWVRFHFPCHEQTAAQMLEACERGAEVNEDYWDTVIGMVVQGRVDVVRALLKLHSASESNDFKLVDNTLRSMPVYSVYGGIATGEFQILWKHWQAECRSKLASGLLDSQPQLELIVKLVIGDYKAFESIRGNYNSWFDILGGWVMFTAPWSRRHELSAAANACASMAPGRSKLDDMVRALVEGDLHQLIHEIQQISDNGWFATHLTDMLYHCGKLKIMDKHHINVTAQLRESLILEYGSLLMEHKSLWSVGLSYLASVPPEGPRRAELFLERLPVDTEAKAMRIVAEAKKHGLVGVASSVSLCACARHQSAGRLGGALCWAVRARGASACSRAAHAALRQYASTGVRLAATDLLLTAGPAVLLSDTLLFLGKYCDFHRLYKSREFKKAAKLLVSLITSDIAPDYFWETLLLDTLPLLESDEPVFTSSDTYEIMLCLELKSSSLDSEKADLLRLALARNLARTVLAEGDDSEEQ